MTTELTIEALLLEAATLLRHTCPKCRGEGRISGGMEGYTDCATCRGDGKLYPLRLPCNVFCRPGSDHKTFYGYPCSKCDGRGWVPIHLGDSTLDAAAAQCGIRLLTPWPWGDRYPGPVEAVTNGMHRVIRYRQGRRCRRRGR